MILRQTLPLQAAVILLGLLLPPLAVIPLELQKRVIDDVIPAADLGLLGLLAGIYIAAVLGRAVVKFGVIYFRGWIAEIVCRVLRAALIDAVRRRAPEKAWRSLGAATSVMTGEVEPLGGFAAEALNTPLIQGGTLLGVFGFMLATEPGLAAAGIAGLVAEAIITPFLQHWINILTYRRIRTLRRAGRDVIEASARERAPSLIAGLREVRLSYTLRMRMHWLKALLKVMRNLIEHIAEVAVLSIGAWMVMQEATQVGVIVAFLSGLREARGPWSELVNFYRRLVDARVKYRLIYGVIRREGRPVRAGSSPDRG